MKLAAIVAVFATGCSFILTQSPPSPPRTEPVTCKDTYGPPIIDTSLGATGLVGFIVASATPTDDRPSDRGGPLITIPDVVFLLVGLPFAISAVYGFSDVYACRDAKQSDEGRANDAARAAATVRAEATRAAATVLAEKRDQAVALTKAASAAARVGDCDTVMKIGRQLRDLDPVFRTNVFLTDVNIKRCYKPAVTPSMDPAPATQPPPPVAPVQPALQLLPALQLQGGSNGICRGGSRTTLQRERPEP